MENKNTKNFDILKDLELSVDGEVNDTKVEIISEIKADTQQNIPQTNNNIDYLNSDYEVETINIFQNNEHCETKETISNQEVGNIEELNILENVENTNVENSNLENINVENSNLENINDIENEKFENKTAIIKQKNKLVISIIFLTKYAITSAFIFAILLVTTNYSAYLNIAKNYIFQGEMQETSQKLISSVEASNIKEKYSEEKINEMQEEDGNLSIKQMKKEQDKEDINLNIQITPYENRIVIPKIGKNIPLLDIKNRNIDGQKELNDIFMKELEKGVIRYPGSAKPGEEGISFVFGHSSNFPWIKGDYNDVFALLDKVIYDDEVIVYYNQKKYTYKIKEKKVISPGNVSVLTRNKQKSEISLMTCRPIGTTLNRLIITGELISEE